MLSPPGLADFALRPFQTPPPYWSMSWRTVIPSGASYAESLESVAANHAKNHPV